MKQWSSQCSINLRVFVYLEYVSINTAAVVNPELIQELMCIFGKQCIVVALDVKRTFDKKGKYMFSKDGKDYWFEIQIFGVKKVPLVPK